MTAVAAQLGANSLIQFGLSVSDVATLISLGRTARNWMTAQSGDNDFLRIISGDDSAIKFRRGLIDLDAFNKRWRQDCRLLVNGYPQKLYQTIVDNNLEHFSRFTATMVSVVTVLDAFVSTLGVSIVVEDVLKEMLCTTEIGEDVIKADIANRLEAWRSAGVMRGMTTYVRKFRLNLVRDRNILSSYPPITEAHQFRELLIWLLLGTNETYTTPSSDVAAVASCLSFVAFDLLDVRSLQPRESLTHPSCVVLYHPSEAILPRPSDYQSDTGFTTIGPRRIECSTVPLIGSEDAVSIFPLSHEGREKCRFAWTRGQAAAEDVRIQVVVPTSGEVDDCQDLTYAFSSFRSDTGPITCAKGKCKCHTARTPFSGLIGKHAFVRSKSLDVYINDALEEFVSVADWLTMQTSDGQVGEGDDGWVASAHFTNDFRIEAFSVMQSVFLGYYYQLFLRFVDTKSLEMQAVEGDWGFRSTDLLTRMRQYCLSSKQAAQGRQQDGIKLTRQQIVEILCALLLNRRVHLEDRTRFNHCIEVIGKRTLLTASLLRSTDCPNAVGRFVLLDVDTGGIPRDSEGLIRPGESEIDLHPIMKDAPQHFVDEQHAIKHCDLTRHIGADWAGNREKLIVTFRYKGRRLFSLNTAETDLRICYSYVEPVDSSDTANGLYNAVPSGLNDLLDRKLQTGAFGDHPVLFPGL